MEPVEKKRIVEALILGAPDPIPAQRIASIVPQCKPAEVRRFVEELNAAYVREGRAFEISEIAGGYRMRTLPEYAPYLQLLQLISPPTEALLPREEAADVLQLRQRPRLARLAHRDPRQRISHVARSASPMQLLQAP